MTAYSKKEFLSTRALQHASGHNGAAGGTFCPAPSVSLASLLQYHQTPAAPLVAVSVKPASIPRSASPDKPQTKGVAHEHIKDAESVPKTAGRERETTPA